MNDSEISALVQKMVLFNDQTAFKRLFWHYYDYLFYFSRSFVKSTEVAEEIVEDAFVALWSKRNSLPEIKSLKAYMYTTVKRLSINYLNRSRSRFMGDLDQLDVSLTAVTTTPEDQMIASELLEAVNKAIADLPPRCRIIYKLVREDGLRYKEVADILGISVKTVEYHIAVALRKITAEIDLDLRGLTATEQKVSRNIP